MHAEHDVTLLAASAVIGAGPFLALAMGRWRGWVFLGGGEPTVTLSTALLPALAMLSAAAGAIHLSVMTAHMLGSPVLGMLFAAAAWSQLGLAALLLRSPSRAVLLVGLAVNAAIVAGWLWSRTLGLPFGLATGPEAVGSVDLLATLYEVALVVGLGALGIGAPIVRRQAEAASSSLALILIAISVVTLTTSALAQVPVPHAH